MLMYFSAECGIRENIGNFRAAVHYYSDRQNSSVKLKASSSPVLPFGKRHASKAARVKYEVNHQDSSYNLPTPTSTSETRFLPPSNNDTNSTQHSIPVPTQVRKTVDFFIVHLICLPKIEIRIFVI